MKKETLDLQENQPIAFTAEDRLRNLLIRLMEPEAWDSRPPPISVQVLESVVRNEVLRSRQAKDKTRATYPHPDQSYAQKAARDFAHRLAVVWEIAEKDTPNVEG
jgi:hypothetical protein